MKVEFGGKYYVAQWWTSNNQPGQDWGDWQYFGNSCYQQEEQKEEVEENEIPDEAEDPDHPSPHGPPSKKAAEYRESQLTNTPLFEMVKASIATLDSAEVEKIAAERAGNPENVKRVESILTEEQWDYLFAVRDPNYTYRRFTLIIKISLQETNQETNQ